MPENQVAPEAKVEATPPVEVKEIVVEPAISEPAKVEATEPPKVVEVAPFVTAPARPELDFTKSHKERIVSFLDSRKGAGKIKLNDFLKALFPLPSINQPAEYSSQPKMKKLRQDLRELKEEGKVTFVNDSFERLGRAHFPDQTTGRTHYWDILTLPIEVIVL